jgi:dCTP deaminase
MLQVIDAMGHNGDCQREHQYRKLANPLQHRRIEPTGGFGSPDEQIAQSPDSSRSSMLKSDRWIRKTAREHDMINPFSEKQVRDSVISYGLSSYGYDLRVADEFKIFTNVNSTIVDPKNFDEKSFVTVRTDICIVPPNSFALARSVEYFKIPRDILTICVGKSTYARCGIIVNVTPFEPEWEGFVTLEISNTTLLPAHLRQRRAVPDFVLPVRRSVRDQLRRQER